MVKVRVTVKFTLEVASKPMAYVKAAELVPIAEYIAVDDEKPAATDGVLDVVKKQVLGK